MIKADVDGSGALALCDVVGFAGIVGDAVTGVPGVEEALSIMSSVSEAAPLRAFFFFVIIEVVECLLELCSCARVAQSVMVALMAGATPAELLRKASP